MAYRPLWKSLASEARGGKGLVLAIDAALEALWDAIEAINGANWGTPVDVSISSGEVAYSTGKYNYLVDTESLLITDQLTKITGVPANQRILLRAKDASRSIQLVDGDYLKLRGDFTLDGLYDSIILIGTDSGVCYEESRCSPNINSIVDEDNDMKFGAAYDVTIASGVITGSSSYRNLRVDTESGDATDDLTTIMGYSEGDSILISPAHASRTVVVKDGAGINLQGVDFSMNDITDVMMLVCLGGNTWKEISRSAN